MKKYIIAAIGNCVHVAGIFNYSNLLDREGDWKTIFLGPAVDISKLVSVVLQEKPNKVGISYRLTPANVIPLLDELQKLIDSNNLHSIKWEFGGTRPVVQIAKKYKFFSVFFDGSEDIDFVINHIRGVNPEKDQCYPQNICDRIESKKPYPVLRHHFGLPSLDKTIDGIKEIAESKVLDIISLGPDQNTQQFFFHQEEMNHALDGSGGVPIRSEDDFIRLYKASRYGNYPLLRCYSGTNEVMKMAKLLLKTINNAWAAIPVCWYNVLDGRGKRLPEVSINDGMKLMVFHAQKNIPVEINEPHHWALRDAPDVMFVAMSYISAYIAKKMGVKKYIAQYMFNTPNSQTHAMDLSKMLASAEMVESLQDGNFTSYRQIRAGLTSLNSDLYIAKGQLAASTYTSMYLKPHIVHVVGYCEGEHAASADDLIESCKIVRGVIRSIMNDQPNPLNDSRIIERKNELISQAEYLINFINEYFKEYDDPIANPIVLAKSIKLGILDAPHLKGNLYACGKIQTRIVDGKCETYSAEKGTVISEYERLKSFY